MYILRVKDHFDAAHFLPWHEGKCKNLHGHRWEVEVIIQSEILDENGIVVDFGVVKGILEAAMPDHACLNDYMENPTAENIAEDLYDLVETALEILDYRFPHLAIRVWESPNCSVTYTPVGDKK